ncbi:MAG: tRNA (guanosine(46)-N7)-methyltransferase TrmB [Pseudomonadota bacterium]
MTDVKSTVETGEAAPARRGPRLYGRQKGHALSAHRRQLMQDRLPGLRLPLASATPARASSSLFGKDCKALWLEIGFGAGEHLLAQARANPDVGLIGCEPFENGVAKVVGAIDTEGLANIRVHDNDARDVVSWLADKQVHRCFILFPDPWPKKRHAKRRLVAPEFLRELARVMVPGAELRFATDIADYQRTGLAAVLKSGLFNWPAREPQDWRERSEDWPATRYEGKAIAAGRRCAYFTFRRNAVLVR